MEQQSVFSNLIYSFIACCFTASVALTIFLGTFGWLISGWDPFEWTRHENFLMIFVGPAIYYISCLVTFVTLDLLVSRTKTRKLSALLSANNYGSFFGIVGYFMIPIGIGIFTTSRTDSGEVILVIPILTLYLGFIAILGLFGLYLAWCDPTPKNATELEEWREYVTHTQIPVLKWLYIWFIFYFIGIGILIIPLDILNSIFPNPITSYYADYELYYSLQEAIVFFPGPFLHTIAFIIYYWHPLRLKLNLYLLKHRSGSAEEGSRTANQPKDRPNNGNKIQEAATRGIFQGLDADFSPKPRWFRFLLIILLVQIFFVVAFRGIDTSNYWQIFIILYSFWIWFFYLNMFLVSRLGMRLGFVNK
ncbi:MAG: hypothetical protein ACFFC7_27755 [Candidatus Hermodarchaeota archaeon]